MRTLLLALPLLGLMGCQTDDRPLIVVNPDGTTDEIAPCAKGCSAPTPDETHPITDEEVALHIEALQNEPVGTASLALETLLFHPDRTVEWLDAHPDALDAERRAFLQTELSRHDVQVSFRLVDDAGNIRGEATRVTPLKEKQHIALLGTGDLKRIEINGKTKRVGLHHLWSRW